MNSDPILTDAELDAIGCTCSLRPFASACGNFVGNESLCICADIAIGAHVPG